MLEIIFKEKDTEEILRKNENVPEEEPKKEIMEKPGKDTVLSEESYEQPDEVTIKFRKLLKEKQEQTDRRKKVVLSYGKSAGTALFLLFCGAVLSSALKIFPEESKMSLRVQKPETNMVIVEELPGNVPEQKEETVAAMSDSVHQAREDEEQAEERPAAAEEELGTQSAAVKAEQEKQPEEQSAAAKEEQEKQSEEQSAAEKEEAVERSEENSNIVEKEQEEPVAQSEEAGAGGEEIVAESKTYIVQAGDTLAGISRKHYGNEGKIQEICELNKITDGDYIWEGETILLP